MKQTVFRNQKYLCGIYAVVNNENGKIYIGKSNNFYGRFMQHRSSLKRGCHRNIHMQRAFEKYGEKIFSFKILFYCDEEMLDFFETMVISHYDSKNPVIGYNLNDGGSGSRNPRPETRRKISRDMSGKNAPMLGKKHSLETRRRFSKARIGNKYGVGNKNGLKNYYKKQNSTSSYYGVSKRTHKKRDGFVVVKWRANISIDGKKICLGTFDSEKDAGIAFDDAYWELYHDFEKLNFPERFE